MRKIEHILAVLGNTVNSIIRSKHCITLVRGWPHRNVQVISILPPYKLTDVVLNYNSVIRPGDTAAVSLQRRGADWL